MDGLAPIPTAALNGFSAARQTTLKAPIFCQGVGLHGGQEVSVRLQPAPEGHGIVFLRTDLGIRIPARFDHVASTRLCTALALPGQPETEVGTVEHLMAALAAARIDNALIELDGPELPILDGSAEPWLFLLDCAGTETQMLARQAVTVLRSVRVEQDDAFAELRPCGTDGFEIALSIAFGAEAIGRQALSLRLDAPTFRHELARARTFTLRHEIEGLRAAGLARGGSLDNAVVVDGGRVLNPSGLRCPDEFVRHKMLDVVGDLALAGAPLVGRFIGHKTGHALNNRLLHALFADQSNWAPAARSLLLAA